MASEPVLNAEEKLLMDALCCAVHSRRITVDQAPEGETLQRLIRLARQQVVLPLLMQASYESGLFSDRKGPFGEARRLTVIQAARTAEFLLLLRDLEQSGLRPAVIKGLVCRSMYPEPEQRASTDEDLLIQPEEYPAYRQALLACGLRLWKPEEEPGEKDEVTFVDPERDLYIEVHLRPFSSDSEALSDCNRFFEEALSRTVELAVYGQTIRTLHPTDHLLYMLCHAYKHILYSGVGVRQICDVCLFAARFVAEIDWARLRQSCAELGIETLAAAFFRIGQRHLELSALSAFADLDVDELPLLKDCLGGGIYGADDPNRLRSSRITLDAVASSKRGGRRHSLIKSLFPSADSIARAYPYLRDKPWLLPLAWGQRIWRYAFDRNTQAVRSLEIGRERVDLLRRYGILP